MGCLIVERSEKPDYYFNDIAIGAFEVCILLLTFVKVYRSSWTRRLVPRVRTFTAPSPVHASVRGSPVVSVLYRDALLNYVLVLIVVNLALLWAVPPIRTKTLAPAALGRQRVAHAILGSRTLLHMRKANQIRFDISRQTITTMHFQIGLEGAEVLQSFISSSPRDDSTESWLAPLPNVELPSVMAMGGSA